MKDKKGPDRGRSSREEIMYNRAKKEKRRFSPDVGEKMEATGKGSAEETTMSRKNEDEKGKLGLEPDAVRVATR